MSNTPCPIIAIGASAGGLEPLKEFFTTMPSDAGAAYVVIQHLEPKHESFSAQILARVTKMPTVQVSDGMQINVDHVYVIVPNTYLTIKDDVFVLSEPTLDHGLRLPINAFFTSIAQQYKQHAIAIVVSGTGSDGTQGLQAIKENGGLAFAQSPSSAEYAGMPKSAIDSGLVDIVCSIKEMPKQIIDYLKHPYLKKSEQNHESALKKDIIQTNRILSLLQSRTGHDFKVYKKGTLGRRISRRMSLLNIKTLSDYLDYLRNHDKEVNLLFKDLLIGVTAFFRDPEAFDALNEKVLAPLVESKAEDELIRVWVPGCSTGEEAYSIAILLFEQLEKSNKYCNIQIFASDIDEQALSHARAGLYPQSMFTLFPKQRLNRFFSKEDQSYRVSKGLRESITFATQNLVSDPPFSNLDLISCRNLLIYLNTDIQRKVLALFHFALKQDAYLFLGHSETCSQQANLFEPLSKKWRIYQRCITANANSLEFPIGLRSPASRLPIDQVKQTPKAQLNFANLAQMHLLQEFAPAAVLVNEKYQVLHFWGPTSGFLEQPSGAPTNEIFSLVRKELRPKLRAAFRRVITEKKRIIVDDVFMMREGSKVKPKIMLKPIQASHTSAILILITFEISSEQKIIESPKSESDKATDKALIQQMEDELYTTREDLQSNIEELESTNEELQASNEEAMSVNEELQSSNEELESSKEELQSMNEELTTINCQYKDKVEELAKSHDDISNLLSSTEIATIFIDSQLRIGRFTPATKALLNLLVTDIGRPLGDIRLKFDDKKLLDEVKQVIDNLVPLESEIINEKGDYYLKRIRPYRTQDNRIDGVVISFIDITQSKLAQMPALRLATIVKDSNDAVISLSPKGDILIWNHGATQMYGWTEQEALKLNIQALIPSPKRSDFKSKMQQIISHSSQRCFDSQRISKNGRIIEVSVTLTPLFNKNGELIELATTERDITDQKGREAALKASEANFRALVESAPDALIIVNEKGRIEITNSQAEILFGYQKDELIKMRVEQLIPTRFHSSHVVNRVKYSKHPQARSMLGADSSICAITKTGVEIPVEVSLSPIKSDHGTLVSAAVRDISSRKELEKTLLNAKLEADSALKAKSRFLSTASHDLRQPLHSLSLLNKALLKSVTDPQSIKMLKLQNESLMGMSQLLNALLDISKLESGTVSVNRSLFSLKSLLEQVTAQFYAEAKEKGLKLDLKVSDEFVFSDEDLVKQLIYNIVSNAIRYTNKGSIEISAVVENNSVKVSIKDTGMGIPSDQIANIFEEFHQVNPDPQLRHGGLGLGLAIVNNIAKLLNTNIDVVSKVGAGSTFSFVLPLASVSQTKIQLAEVTSSDPIIEHSVVLLIDDDPSVLEASQMLLSMEPELSVEAVSSPLAAYAITKKIKPDLIISDYHLNDVQYGIDVIKAIRKQFKEVIPAILISGDTSLQASDIKEEKIESLVKPIDPDTLLSKIKQLLAKHD